jgi:hypothetical protein
VITIKKYLKGGIKMKQSSNYIKDKTKKRPAKISSVALESYQVRVIEKNNLNLSAIVRDLLNDFLMENFKGDLENEIKKEGEL